MICVADRLQIFFVYALQRLHRYVLRDRVEKSITDQSGGCRFSIDYSMPSLGCKLDSVLSILVLLARDYRRRFYVPKGHLGSHSSRCYATVK